MRQPRDFKPDMCCHLISRVAHRAFYLNDEERTRFVYHLWRTAAFSGVTLLAYCVMENHFHILAHFPVLGPLSDDELLSRIREFYAGEQLDEIEDEWSQISGSPSGQEAFRKRFLKRMGNASEFMKTLKQTVTMSINSRNRHAGTMWESRFRAHVFDPKDKAALLTVAAYIDCNPVKAKIVAKPEDYPWGSFTAACQGNRRAIAGYRQLYSSFFDTPPDWSQIRELHENALARALPHASAKPAGGRASTTAKAIEDVERGILPHLVERGRDKIAFKTLLLLREGPLTPEKLRHALGLKTAQHFSSYYLKPLSSAGLIELADCKSIFSRAKKFRLTEKGSTLVDAHPH